MKERPILFTPSNVRAILDGRKTQTRRIVKDLKLKDGRLLDQTGEFIAYPPNGAGYRGMQNSVPVSTILGLCPYGKPGDRLWARETFYAYGWWFQETDLKKMEIHWRFEDICDECRYLDNPPENIRPQRIIRKAGWYKRPSIFMEKKYSRISLELKEVRVERLQDCSEADACAEGCGDYLITPDYSIEQYIDLWESINGAGSWALNPWVWVLEFREVKNG